LVQYGAAQADIVEIRSFHPRRRREATSLTLTECCIMNSKLTTWLLSFALAVLLFVIIGIVLFDRMHALMRVLGRDLATLKLALG
jgi:hypothetical protein